MKPIFLFAVIVLSLVFGSKDQLKGRWESKSENGASFSIVFKDDNSFEGFMNKKAFVSGTYSYSQADSIFKFVNNGCAGVTGVYKINFYSNSDSMRFVVINDSCTKRVSGMQRLQMGRVVNKY